MAAEVAAAVEAVVAVVVIVAQRALRYLPQAIPITQCTTTIASPIMVQAPVTPAMRRIWSASKTNKKTLALQPRS